MTKIGNSLTERAGLYLAGLRFTKLGMAFREQAVSDFGIDAHAELITGDKATGSLIALQIKSGPSYFNEKSPSGWWFRFDEEHANYWCNHSLPVIIVLCDTKNEQLYWQQISEDTIVNTGNQFKVEIPRIQTIGEDYRILLIEKYTPPAPQNSFSILKEEDVSHAGARRLAVHLLLTRVSSKTEIAAMVREATINQIGSDFYRNPMVEAHWSGVNAHVVWIYLYQTLDDYKQSNCFTRSYWIDPELDHSQRPSESGGENVGLSVMLIWNHNYDYIRQAYNAAKVSKQVYLKTTDTLVKQLSDLLSGITEAFLNNVFDPKDFSSTANGLKDSYSELIDLSQKAQDSPAPPLECEDLDVQVQSLIAFADNIRLFLADDRTWDDNAVTALTKSNLHNFSEAKKKWKFEREKL